MSKDDSSEVPLGDHAEEADIYGPTVTTHELHDVSAHNHHGCDSWTQDHRRWCLKYTELTVKTENNRWVFHGEPSIDLVQDNDGSAAWNRLGDPTRWNVVRRNPHEIVARVLTGSRAIKVRLKCRAYFYP